MEVARPAAKMSRHKLVNAMHLWGEPELLTDLIMHCDAFITGENELLM